MLAPDEIPLWLGVPIAVALWVLNGVLAYRDRKRGNA